MVKKDEELLAQFAELPTARMQKKIMHRMNANAPGTMDPRTRNGQAAAAAEAKRLEQFNKLMGTTNPEQRRVEAKNVAAQLSKEAREKEVFKLRGQAPTPNADFRNVPFFKGYRNEIGWATGFREAWFNAHVDQGPTRTWTCGYKGKARAHKDCVGTSSDMSLFQIDHDVPLFEFIDDQASVLLYCDGKHHWKVYLLGNRDDIKHPVNRCTWWLGSDHNIYRDQGDHMAPKGVQLRDPLPTILEVSHWEANLQVLCKHCNPSKSGATNKGGYRPEHSGECSCINKQAKYLGLT